jgi:hypothetical protein
LTDFLKGYDIQYWLESCPQGYLKACASGGTYARGDRVYCMACLTRMRIKRAASGEHWEIDVEY